jgi:hypothetical protein
VAQASPLAPSFVGSKDVPGSDPTYTSHMEIEGHPTQDLIEELERRGAIRVPGSTAGPNIETLELLHQRVGDSPGSWLFLTNEAYDTGFDTPPA